MRRGAISEKGWEMQSLVKVMHVKTGSMSKMSPEEKNCRSSPPTSAWKWLSGWSRRDNNNYSNFPNKVQSYVATRKRKFQSSPVALLVEGFGKNQPKHRESISIIAYLKKKLYDCHLPIRFSMLTPNLRAYPAYLSWFQGGREG